MKIKYAKISQGLIEGRVLLKQQYACEIFKCLRRRGEPCFLYESKKSVMGIDPVLRMTGKNEDFTIEILNNRGQKYLDLMNLVFCDELVKIGMFIKGKVKKSHLEFEEKDRYKQKNISFVIRAILESLKQDKKVVLGLYGAFSYDFVRFFEDIHGTLPDNDVNDFDFFLYDTFIISENDSLELILYRDTKEEIVEAVAEITEALKSSKIQEGTFELGNAKFVLSREKYENLVEIAKDYCKRGEIVEVVFSNLLCGEFNGDTYALYLKYRVASRAPYMFYFDFGDQQLVGSSPEMMLKVEGNIVQMRPISGTAKRGNDLIEDHENMLKLLCDPKERAELDMLIDLGRNDLSKVCKPGIKISDYRFVEKYSKVMHTIAHLEGELQEGFSALDALFASLNAGTLTGAPKVAAMNLIEKYEFERRGFYGGTIGHFTFSGEMDTAILIRTAHIKNGELKFRVGATLLNKSNPRSEYEETINKASAFTSILKKTI